MKKNLLIISLLFVGIAYGQVFQEDWDGNGPGIGSWTLIDVDGNTPDSHVSFVDNAWVVVDKNGDDGNFGGPEGDNAAISTSWYDPAGTSNDWLISPQITLPADELFVLWDAKAQDGDYPDGYELKLAPNGGDTVDDFTVTLFSVTGEEASWTTHAISLGDYVNTSIRLAWVNNSTDQFALLVDNIKVEEYANELPDCPSLTSPINDATDVDHTSSDGVTFTWDPPTTGGEVYTYHFYIGTSADDLSLYDTTTTETSISITGMSYGTTYYWSVVSENPTGSSDGCEVYSFTTIPSVFEPYCGPLAFSSVEPMTQVTFAGIDNSSSESSDVAHEDFIDVVGNVTVGQSYEITLKGNTKGNFTNRFAVFIDWNQDGEFSGDNEIIEITSTITNSTGTDDISATQTITVPDDAVEGTTRMRVKKIFGETNYLDPCLGTSYGQAEDYSLNVGTLSVTDITGAAKVLVYPNPVQDVLYLNGMDAQKVQISNILGQKVKVRDSSENAWDVSSLKPGAYVIQVEDANGKVKSFKFIKK